MSVLPRSILNTRLKGFPLLFNIVAGARQRAMSQFTKEQQDEMEEAIRKGINEVVHAQTTHIEMNAQENLNKIFAQADAKVREMQEQAVKDKSEMERVLVHLHAEGQRLRGDAEQESIILQNKMQRMVDHVEALTKYLGN